MHYLSCRADIRQTPALTRVPCWLMELLTERWIILLSTDTTRAFLLLEKVGSALSGQLGVEEKIWGKLARRGSSLVRNSSTLGGPALMMFFSSEEIMSQIEAGSLASLFSVLVSIITNDF